MILLGKSVTIVDAANKGLIGLSGTVVADNRDTLTIRTPQGEKLFVKHTLTLQSEGFIIEGKSLLGTQSQRAKK